MRGRLRCLGTTGGIFGRLLYMLGVSIGNRTLRILIVLAIENWKRVLDKVESTASKNPRWSAKATFVAIRECIYDRHSDRHSV